jgi:hypothetical protein
MSYTLFKHKPSELTAFTPSGYLNEPSRLTFWILYPLGNTVVLLPIIVPLLMDPPWKSKVTFAGNVRLSPLRSISNRILYSLLGVLISDLESTM